LTKLGLWLGLPLVAGGALVAVWLGLGLPVPACRLRELTGVPCPTCGSTRLAQSLLQGDLTGAFLANPFVFALLAAASFWFAGSVLVRLFRVRLPELRLPPLGRRLFLVAIVAALLASWAWVVLRDV
jgi:hypothetical protein